MTGICNLHSCATYGGLYSEGRFALERENIPNAALDARVLLQFATGRTWQKLFDEEDEIASPGEIVAFSEAIDARLKRMPVAHITGVKEFWSLEFKVNAATLIPRPESEHLVEQALAFLPKELPGRVLDLGTGTGCLLISILHERPNLTGVGVDISSEALEIARANAKRHGMAERAAFVHGDWTNGASGLFDIIVANPPYLTAEELEAAEPEVRDHEPRLALCPGTDGLTAYREIAKALSGLLKPGAAATFEIGSEQAESVARILESAGLDSPRLSLDLAGLPRVIAVRKALTNKELAATKKGLESEA